MSDAACPVNRLTHDWNNGLVCRWCDATRTPEEAILSGLASRRGGDEASARDLLEAFRVAALTKAGVEYEDCPVCGAACGVGRPCGTCEFKARMAAEAGEKVTAAAAPATPFFQPGHTYTREHHGDTIRFLVKYVSTSPDGRYRAAHGWRTRSWDPSWEPSDSDDLTGWTDTTKAGEPR